MKKINFILAVALAAMTLSCEKSEQLNNSEAQTEKYIKTFTCEFAAPESMSPDSKVALASNGKTTWEVGDKIMLHGGTDGASRKLVTLAAGDISADGKKATFTVEGLAPYDRTSSGVVSTYYAQYPGDVVPSGNMYYECAFNNTNRLLLAACNVGDTFQFFNLCGVISYIVDGDFDSVVFSGNNGETVAFSDFYQVRVRDDGSGAYCNYHKAGNGFPTNTASTTVSTSVVSDGYTVNYIYLPKGVNFTGGFLFKFMKSGNIVNTVTVTSGVNVDHGKLLPLGDITAHLKAYTPPTEHIATDPAITSAVNLSATATANSYIVDGSDDENAGKVFKFKAVKGNSTTGVGAIESVDVLWETYNNATSVTAHSVIAKVDFDKRDGDDDYWITFQMPADLHAGNAVIAAKDAGGNILWSWHIWVPATTIVTADYGIHTTSMMDRNLGALVVAEASTTNDIDITSVGLYYQWGRKDPFPGPREIKKDPSDLYASVAKVAGTAMSRDKVQITLAESILQPTFLARGYYDGDTQKNPDWCSESNAEYWGDSGDKSMYDPCPPGYRVPKRDSTKPLWQDDITAAAGWGYSEEHYWFKVGNPATVFPAAGYLDGGSIKTVFRATIWNSHSNNYTNTYGFSHYAAYARRVYTDSGVLKTKNNGDPSKYLGNSVRCCVE